MDIQDRPIGVMDSGLGGISVLRELVRLLPAEDFIYYGDSAHAPYGTKTPEEITRRSMEVVEFLLEQGAKAIVVACNTATSAAIGTLRETWPDIPVIGIEPALKPAVQARSHSRILVMATDATLKLERFNHMEETYKEDADIVKAPCPGLVELIEAGVLDGPELDAYLEDRFPARDREHVDAVVLGCTHFPLVRAAVQRLFPDSVIYDGSYGTAKQTRRRLEEAGLLSRRQEKGTVMIYNSKEDDALLKLSRQLLECPLPGEAEGDGTR